jgi:hypothetical protein
MYNVLPAIVQTFRTGVPDVNLELAAQADYRPAIAVVAG